MQDLGRDRSGRGLGAGWSIEGPQLSRRFRRHMMPLRTRGSGLLAPPPFFLVKALLYCLRLPHPHSAWHCRRPWNRHFRLVSKGILIPRGARPPAVHLRGLRQRTQIQHAEGQESAEELTTSKPTVPRLTRQGKACVKRKVLVVTLFLMESSAPRGEGEAVQAGEELCERWLLFFQAGMPGVGREAPNAAAAADRCSLSVQPREPMPKRVVTTEAGGGWAEEGKTMAGQVMVMKRVIVRIDRHSEAVK